MTNYAEAPEDKRPQLGDDLAMRSHADGGSGHPARDRARRGEVCDIARVTVNDVDDGIAWTAPFRLDIAHAVRAGANELTVEVVTLWRNRLIAGAYDASGEIFAPTTTVFEPDACPFPPVPPVPRVC